MRKLLLATAAGIILPSLAWADDARLGYKTTTGATASVLPITAVCSVSSDGTPQLCKDGLLGTDTSGTDGRLAYKNTNGSTATAMPVVPVCSVIDGVPQVCNFGGSTPDLSSYLTTATAVTTYAQLAARNSFTAEQQFANAYFADPDQGVSRDAKFGDRGIAVAGGTKTDTLTVTDTAATGALTVTGNIAEQGIPTFTNSSGQVTGALTGSTAKWQISRIAGRGYTGLSTYTGGQWIPFMFNDDGTLSTTIGTLANLGADVEFTKTLTVDGATSVPDTSLTDSTKSALNTESAAARFLSKSNAENEYAQLAGGNTFTSEQHFADSTFTDPDPNVARDAKFGNDGIAVSGGTKTDTLSVTTAAYVPDTSTTDKTTAALNTETAAARFVSSTTAATTYETIAGMSSYALKTNGTLTTPSITKPSIDSGALTTDGNGNWILSGNNGIKFGNAEWLNYNATDGYIAVNGDLEITGRVNLPTRTTGDNGNYAASTAFVQNTINAMQGSVTGDLSASGGSLTLPIGASGLNFVMSYSASGTGALTAVSASGTLTPVDIYEVAAWDTTSFKGYTLDSGTITTTATSIDSTFYLTSNAVGTYHVGVGGHLYIVDIFGSGAGKRTFMSWRKVY